MDKNNVSEAELLSHLPFILHPYYCGAIACPMLKDGPCGACRLKELLALADSGDLKARTPQTGSPDMPGYDPDDVPCPLGNLKNLKYSDWLILSEQHFKNTADTAINLIVKEYENGMMNKPYVAVQGYGPDGRIKCTVHRVPDHTRTYKSVASMIYSRMRLIEKAQIVQDSRSPGARTSVTMSISYLPEARVEFLNEVKRVCGKRYTKEMDDSVVQEETAKWAKEMERQSVRRKQWDMEKERQASAMKRKLENAKQQCAKANERYGTGFFYNSANDRVFMDLACCGGEEKLAKRVMYLEALFGLIQQAGWIRLKVYKYSPAVFKMCGTFSRFKSDYPDLWDRRSMGGRHPGVMQNTWRLIAYVNEMYRECVDIMRNYPAYLKKEEEKRSWEMEDPARIVDSELAAGWQEQVRDLERALKEKLQQAAGQEGGRQ